ncbi:MAG: hypothetical protein AAFQ68_17495 [Bacteroidota bacterium]
MFPISKKEKRGKAISIIFLLVPILILLAVAGGSLYQRFPEHISSFEVLILGIVLGFWSLFAFGTFHGKQWARILLLIFVSGFCAWLIYMGLKREYSVRPITDTILNVLTNLAVFALPNFLLLLPAPRAFFRYQREKHQRHLQVLSQKVEEIGQEDQ